MAGYLAVPPAGTTWRGRVGAVFSRCVHLALADRCLTLGATSLPAHPYSLLWPDFPSGWSVGQEVVLTPSTLSLPDGRRVCLDELARYAPSPPPRPMAAPQQCLAALAASRDRAACLPAVSGCDALFHNRPGPALQGTTSRISGALGALEDRLRAHLARALASRRWADFARTAGAMAGLGIGLTPAGDDFLGGVLAALRYHGACLEAPILPSRRLEALAAALARRTTPFSGFLLTCAARGQVAAAVDDWLRAVHAGEAAQAVRNVDRLAAIGHSSGLDTLAGMLLALSIFMGEHAWTRTQT